MELLNMKYRVNSYI